MKRHLTATFFTLFFLGCGLGEQKVPDSIIDSISKGTVIIDVRNSQEFAEGHFPGAINIPHDDILTGVKKIKLAKSEALILYCRSGNRSRKAQEMLINAGFTNTQNAGGLNTLLAARGLGTTQ